MIKKIGYFIAGAVFGSAITFCLLKDQLKEKPAKATNKNAYEETDVKPSENGEEVIDICEPRDVPAEINSGRERYISEDEEVIEYSLKREEALEKADKGAEKNTESQEKIFRTERKKPMINYQKYGSQKDLLEEADSAFEDEPDEMDEFEEDDPWDDIPEDGTPFDDFDPDKYDEIEGITPEDFRDTNLHFDKCEVYVWNDGVIASTDTGTWEDVTEDMRPIITDKWREYYEEYERWTSYIRNNRYSTDVAVYVKDDNFYEEDELRLN